MKKIVIEYIASKWFATCDSVATGEGYTPQQALTDLIVADVQRKMSDCLTKENLGAGTEPI